MVQKVSVSLWHFYTDNCSFIVLAQIWSKGQKHEIKRLAFFIEVILSTDYMINHQIINVLRCWTVQISSKSSKNFYSIRISVAGEIKIDLIYPKYSTQIQVDGLLL